MSPLSKQVSCTVELHAAGNVLIFGIKDSGCNLEISILEVLSRARCNAGSCLKLSKIRIKRTVPILHRCFFRIVRNSRWDQVNSTEVFKRAMGRKHRDWAKKVVAREPPTMIIGYPQHPNLWVRREDRAGYTRTEYGVCP